MKYVQNIWKSKLRLMKWDYEKEPGLKIINRGQGQVDKAFVSIITPFFNSGKHFVQTYNCIMNQTFPWFEWIIVNDGSTNKEDIIDLQKLADSDKRIRLYHTENMGAAGARNHAVAHACTQIIIPIDADDLITPTYIEYLYWALYFNPEASWAYTDSIGFSAQQYVWEKCFDSERMKVSNFLTNSAAIRRDIFLRVGGYETAINLLHEDWELWLKLMGEGAFPVHVKDCSFWYRRSESGRFVSVENVEDRSVRRDAKDRINKSADRIEGIIHAIEYPVNSDCCINKKYEKLSWPYKVFVEHKKINVCVLIPSLEYPEMHTFALNIINQMNKDQYEFSVLTTIKSSNLVKQKYQEYVTDLFELPSFLRTQEYAEFISYFIQSREVDILLVNNCCYEYYLLPWIRREFPELIIVDYIEQNNKKIWNKDYLKIRSTSMDIFDKTCVYTEVISKDLIKRCKIDKDIVDILYTNTYRAVLSPYIVRCSIIKKKPKVNKELLKASFQIRYYNQNKYSNKTYMGLQDRQAKKYHLKKSAAQKLDEIFKNLMADERKKRGRTERAKQIASLGSISEEYIELYVKNIQIKNSTHDHLIFIPVKKIRKIINKLRYIYYRINARR